MAKTEAAKIETPATEAAPAATTGRSVILKLDAEHAALVGVVEGSEMKRTDYIRARWQGGVDRGPIAKELTKIQGKEVPYQIVFQATKGIEGGSKPVAASAGEAAPAGDAS